MDELEKYLSRAEIAYKSGQVLSAIKNARKAIKICSDESKKTALQIFTARAYSKLGDYTTSNDIYRKLLNEKNYLPPVIMGLLYNSVKQNNNIQKSSRNLGLIKLYVR